MATTKIWDVSAHVSKLLAYVTNKNKTTMKMKCGTDDEEMRLAAAYTERCDFGASKGSSE